MPVTIKSTGGGSVTVQAPNTASDYTVNFPATNGDMVVASGGAVSPSQGGTGQTSLTANNVLLGNGTSAVQFVAPGTNGNVLTSNGTTWTSAALPAGGVTSLTAGNGITVSASTGAVTVSQDIYTGSTSTNTSYPIGSYVSARKADAVYQVNSSQTIYSATTSGAYLYVGTSGGSGSSALTGTWRARGVAGYESAPGCGYYSYTIFQRTA